MDGFGSVAGMRGPLSNGPEAWYRGLPPITRAVMTATFVLTLLATLDFLPVHVFVLDWSLVVGKLQVWRLLTTVLFIGKFSLGWMLHMYMWVQISGDLENNAVFARASAGAYLMFVFLMTISTSLLSLLVFWPRGLPFHSEAVLFAALYYWSRREAYTPVSIYFLTVQGYQLPFVLLLLHLLIGRDLWLDAIGMAAGHAYYFFREILPAQDGPDLLSKTPKCFESAAQFLANGGLQSAARGGQTAGGGPASFVSGGNPAASAGGPARRGAGGTGSSGEGNNNNNNSGAWGSLRRRQGSPSSRTEPFSGPGYTLGGGSSS